MDPHIMQHFLLLYCGLRSAIIQLHVFKNIPCIDSPTVCGHFTFNFSRDFVPNVNLSSLNSLKVLQLCHNNEIFFKNQRQFRLREFDDIPSRCQPSLRLCFLQCNVINVITSCNAGPFVIMMLVSYVVMLVSYMKVLNILSDSRNNLP